MSEELLECRRNHHLTSRPWYYHGMAPLMPLSNSNKGYRLPNWEQVLERGEEGGWSGPGQGAWRDGGQDGEGADSARSAARLAGTILNL
jgi:hypothetical protein